MNAPLEILDAAPVINSALTSSLQQVQSEVAAFDRIAAGLAAIEAAHPSNLAVDVTTTAGMKQAIAGRAAYREPRINVEKARKAAKAPVLELGKQIDAFAAGLESQLRIGEINYDEQIKAEEARKENERKAKAEAEAARVAKIRANITAISNHANMAVGVTSETVLKWLSGVEAFVVDGSFEEFRAEAEQVKAETIERLKALHEAACAQEAEQARIKAEREELARLRAEQEARERAAAAERAEQERKDREARAETERIAAKELAEQRAKQEAELKAQRAAQEAELAAQREAQAKIEAEAKAVRDAEAARIAAERAAFERQQREAEQARIAEAQRQVAEAQKQAFIDAKTRDAAFLMLDALHEIEKLTTEPKVKAIAVKAIKAAKE